MKIGVEHASTIEAAWNAIVKDANLIGGNDRLQALHAHATAVKHTAGHRAQHWRWRRPGGVVTFDHGFWPAIGDESGVYT